MKLTDVSRALRRLRWKKRCSAVIVAAGTASRMQGIDKIMEPLGGIPVILRTVQAFQNCQEIQKIVIVTREALILPISELCRDCDKVQAVVAGGASRQESVERGLAALKGQAELVAIQDGARPLVTPALIARVVFAAQRYGAAIPAIPVKDTIKIAKNTLVTATPDRKKLQAVQTPQVFDYDLLRGALAQAKKDHAVVTDDASAVERLGMAVKIVEGAEENIKITTPLDLEIAQRYLEEQL
ncbi:MAG TPA: 2-C-methyl-D-erythritol 4-phosphate cytidylyltransferase [Candidatus Faecousia intestinigallinarum]|nr:2-C-methyl-D-erythritol 4-phosphate cytidylyltransferase [Candidatus Faecousia intestinigallinarum]